VVRSGNTTGNVLTASSGKVQLPHISDLLNRFRPIGAPGSASRTGVPADRAAELAAELEPVLTLLAATEEECAAMVAEAARRAVLVSGEAHRQANGIAAEARDRAAAATDRVIATAHREADRIERSAAEAARGRRELGEAQVWALAELALRVIGSAPGA
jgi:hypothetical protein